MTTPSIRRISNEEARRQLQALEDSILAHGSIEDFEDRASRYELSPTEAGLWEKILELRWLVN